MAIEYLTVIPENIPAELKQLKQWVVWKPEKKPGKVKPDKVPYSLQLNSATGIKEEKHAAVDNPDTWMTFDEALQLMKSKRKYKGLNFALTEESGIVGIDIDHAIDAEGNRDENKFNEIKNLKTYAELSPSGKGLRAFCFGTFPDGEEIHKGDFETYKKNHFLSVTGHRLKDAPSTVNNVQEALTEFRARYFKQAKIQIESKLPVTPIELTDLEIINRLANSKAAGTATKFRKLFYNGDTEEYGNDHSSADMALVSKLVFYTQKEEQIDRIFRQSKLFRPEKWDRNAGYLDGENVTYGQRTIRVGLRNRKDVFKGDTKESEVYVDLFPYKITSEGIFKKVPSKDNPQEIHEVRISSTPCKITAIGDNIDTGEILYKICITDVKKREKIFWKPGEDLLTRTGALSLIKDGMVFKEPNVLDIENLFDIYIQNSALNLPEEITASRSGWKKNNSIFVVGDTGYTKEGIMPIKQLDSNIADLYIKKGTLEGWVNGAEILLKYDAVRLKFYAACAPLILGILGTQSFILEQQASSGMLKTLSHEACASMFGIPSGNASLMLNARSTSKGIEAFVGFNTDLPTFIDETSNNIEEIRKLVYMIANGIGRGTSNKKHGYEMPKTWRTVALTTGENPILPSNAKTGELVRVIPLREGVTEHLSDETIRKIEEGIRGNYGHVKDLLIKEIFDNKDKIKDIYSNYLSCFETPENNNGTANTDSRAKRFYATIATAGFLLESVFADIGITQKDPFDVVNKYYVENLIKSTEFIPDHIRALNAFYSWFTTNRILFEENNDHTTHKVCGAVDEREGVIYILPEELEKVIKEYNYNYKACEIRWKAEGILLSHPHSKKRPTAEYKFQKIINGVKAAPYKLKLPNTDEYAYTDPVELSNTDDREIRKPRYKPRAPKALKADIKTLNECEAECNSVVQNEAFYEEEFKKGIIYGSDPKHREKWAEAFPELKEIWKQDEEDAKALIEARLVPESTLEYKEKESKDSVYSSLISVKSHINMIYRNNGYKPLDIETTSEKYFNRSFDAIEDCYKISKFLMKRMAERGEISVSSC